MRAYVHRTITVQRCAVNDPRHLPSETRSMSIMSGQRESMRNASKPAVDMPIPSVIAVLRHITFAHREMSVIRTCSEGLKAISQTDPYQHHRLM